MSIKVLKARAQSRRLVSEKNSVARMPVNLYYSRNKGLCCPTKSQEPNPSGGIYIAKTPAPQKSYGNYTRQAMMGYTGLANRVVSLRNSQTDAQIPNEPSGKPERITFKRMPEFSQSQYLKNLGKPHIREDKCNPVSPKCNNDCSDKTKHSITKSIGFLSEGEYLQQKILKKITPLGNGTDNCKYELPLAPSSNNRNC
jgi:hypothetical protein